VLTVDDMKRMNYLPVFFVAAAVSMGKFLVADQDPRAADQSPADVDGAAARQPPAVNARALLDRVRLSHLPGQRDFDAGDIPAGADEFCEEPRNGPAAHRHDLDLRRRGKLFAYQSGVLIVGMSYGNFDIETCSASAPC